MRAFRLCVDLNVWISQFLGTARGLRNTAAQTIVEAVQNGRSAVGPIQLVISHTMLTRLQDVLIRRGIAPDTAEHFAHTVASFARLGPAPEFPHVVLGGGTEPTRDARMPTYDPYDPAVMPPRADVEDGRVIDTALAGEADALVTNDFKDFILASDTVIVEGRVHIRGTAKGQLVLIRPPEMARWLQTGRFPRSRSAKA